MQTVVWKLPRNRLVRGTAIFFLALKTKMQVPSPLRNSLGVHYDSRGTEKRALLGVLYHPNYFALFI